MTVPSTGQEGRGTLDTSPGFEGLLSLESPKESVHKGRAPGKGPGQGGKMLLVTGWGGGCQGQAGRVDCEVGLGQAESESGARAQPTIRPVMGKSLSGTWVTVN